MSRLYVFADEAGNFDFSRNHGASRYFIVATVTAHSCNFGNELLDLHRDLAWRKEPVKGYFHATTDAQRVRDAVFQVICQHDFTLQATIMEKSKAMPAVRRTDSAFYKTGWLYHFRHALKAPVNRADECMIGAASIGTKKRKVDFEDSVRSIVNQFAHKPKTVVAMWQAHCDPCLQFADYCTWAIQRKWEQGDSRSYNLIKDRITYEFDLWGARRDASILGAAALPTIRRKSPGALVARCQPPLEDVRRRRRLHAGLRAADRLAPQKAVHSGRKATL